MTGSPSGTILGDLTHNIQYISLEEASKRVVKYIGGVDVGITNDATSAHFGG